MNTSVNRFSESPCPSGQSLPEESILSAKPKKIIPKQPSSTSQSYQSKESDQSRRQQPIPAPSHPKQYRAIGLIEGHYQSSSDQLTRGNILTADGTVIDAVILGRMISLLKKHIDLEESHLWVVYPRIEQENDQLHVQIVGVWEPETLSKDDVQLPPNPNEHLIKHGYFSVRGEVIFSSPEKQTVIIKIRQSPKKGQEKAKFFKLKLTGKLPERPVSRFWDLQVQLQGDNLVIQEAKDLGFIRNNRSFKNRRNSFPPRVQRTTSSNFRSQPRNKPENKSQSDSERKSYPNPSKIIKKKID